MIPTLPIQVTCPKCGSKYVAQIQSVIDVSQDPRLKSALLQGRMNTVVCPSCSTPGVVSAPLLYHDPGKELLLLYIPPDLNVPLQERERLTGSLVNALMSSLPAESRKGYFLNPRPVLTMQGLIDEILKADGVTKKMLEKQRERSRLLQSLLTAMSDEQKLQSLIEEHREEIDYPFFLTLAAAAEASAAAGQQQVHDNLLALRDALLARVAISLPEPLPLDSQPAKVVDRILAAKDRESRWALVLYNRPLLDYAFFQELTSRIERATPEQAESLRALRGELLEMVEQLDKEAQAVQQAKVQLLQDSLASEDPARVLRERKAEIDALFLAVVGAAARSAQQNGAADELKRLQAINDTVLDILQEDLPPELRLVNDLLAAEYPEATERLLKERQPQWDAQLLELLATLAEDLEAQQRPETAQRLKDLRGQAQGILEASRRPKE